MEACFIPSWAAPRTSRRMGRGLSNAAYCLLEDGHGRLAPRITHRLRNLRCLRDPADLRLSDRCPAAPARKGPHALMGGLASRRIRRELCRAAERQGTPSGLHVGGPGRQLRHARQLLVHALERGRKELLAVQRLVDSTRETSTPRLGFAAVLTLLLACQRALLVAQLSQADLQC